VTRIKAALRGPSHRATARKEAISRDLRRRPDRALFDPIRSGFFRDAPFHHGRFFRHRFHGFGRFHGFNHRHLFVNGFLFVGFGHPFFFGFGDPFFFADPLFFRDPFLFGFADPFLFGFPRPFFPSSVSVFGMAGPAPLLGAAPASPRPAVRTPAGEETAACAAAYIRTTEGTEHQVAVSPQALGAATVGETARALEDRLQAGQTIRLKLLDGTTLTIPADLVDDIEVRPCGEPDEAGG
jgi:hypothetical protein